MPQVRGVTPVTGGTGVREEKWDGGLALNHRQTTWPRAVGKMSLRKRRLNCDCRVKEKRGDRRQLEYPMVGRREREVLRTEKRPLQLEQAHSTNTGLSLPPATPLDPVSASKKKSPPLPDGSLVPGNEGQSQSPLLLSGALQVSQLKWVPKLNILT